MHVSTDHAMRAIRDHAARIAVNDHANAIVALVDAWRIDHARDMCQTCGETVQSAGCWRSFCPVNVAAVKAEADTAAELLALLERARAQLEAFAVSLPNDSDLKAALGKYGEGLELLRQLTDL